MAKWSFGVMEYWMNGLLDVIAISSTPVFQYSRLVPGFMGLWPEFTAFSEALLLDLKVYFFIHGGS